MTPYERFSSHLESLAAQDNLRKLSSATHRAEYIISQQRPMLNLSSNDYLGLASDVSLREEFINGLDIEGAVPSSSSSRLLTGNFAEYDSIEKTLARLFGREAALTFNSGYHANTGILPALSDSRTLILADKLVHASIIDGIRLSGAKYIRYQHNNYDQLEKLVEQNNRGFDTIFIVTESIFSMDGDLADLIRLTQLKRNYSNVLIYVDEAHAIGVRGKDGLGLAQEQGAIADIDILVGTFGKALASTGAYVVCDSILKEYLINKMRTFIFTTALPPVNVSWSEFIVRKLKRFSDRREHLEQISCKVREAVCAKGYKCGSSSHIIPIITGDSTSAVAKAMELQREGFYALPVRPPTVPSGSSRIRLSLTASLKDEDVDRLIELI